MKMPAGFDNLDALVTVTGVKAAKAIVGANKGVTLLANTTYYVPLGSAESGVIADETSLFVHFTWVAAIVLTGVTVELSVFPAVEGGGTKGNPDVADFDPTAGLWVQFNPAQSVDLYGNIVAGAGNAIAAFTVSSTGAAAGAAILHFPNMAARRARLKVVVGATGGLMRFGVHAKPVAL